MTDIAHVHEFEWADGAEGPKPPTLAEADALDAVVAALRQLAEALTDYIKLRGREAPR